MTGAERQARYMEKLRAGGAVTRWRRPQERNLSLIRRWERALAELQAVTEAVQAWRDNMPPGVADSDRASAVDEFLSAAEGWIEEAPTPEW